MNKKAVAAAVLVLAAFLLCGYGWRRAVWQADVRDDAR